MYVHLVMNLFRFGERVDYLHEELHVGMGRQIMEWNAHMQYIAMLRNYMQQVGVAWECTSCSLISYSTLLECPQEPPECSVWCT